MTLPSELLTAEDKRLLIMLHGCWSQSEDGYWPSVDAMKEAAQVIERLARELAAANARAEAAERRLAITAAHHARRHGDCGYDPARALIQEEGHHG